MNTDDIVYISLLVSGILFGLVYRNISAVGPAKAVGTAFGALIVVVVSGWHALHPLLSTLVCGLIILYANKRHAHLLSFAFMFGYLFFFRTTDHFGIPLPSGHTNMIQMILTLKLVGLAFEANTALTKPRPSAESSETESADVLAAHDAEQAMFAELSLADVFHYAFNYIGVLTGPYYRYRTFHDYFALANFKRLAPATDATLRKFAWVPFFAGAYLLVSHFWPLSYATSDEFYLERSVAYRLWYVWPTFFIFRMRIYIGITLSECVCTMAAFGAYPRSAESTAGGGPKLPSYRRLAADSLALADDEFDFETIHNIDALTTDTCWTFREAMKSWNMCVQYWLAVNVYKRFPSKAYRTLVTLLVSAVWHGVYSGYYFCILGAPFYLPIEDIWQRLLRPKDAPKNAGGFGSRFVDLAFWTSKFFAFSYMGIAFLLMTLDKIWFYYGSVYHLGYVYFAVMYGLGSWLLARKRKADRRSEAKRTSDVEQKKDN